MATTYYYVDKRLYSVGFIYCGSNPSDGDYVRIGLIDGTYKQYTFKAALTPAEGEVKINAGGGVLTTQNLSNAINASGGTNGVDYQVSAAHPAVTSYFSTSASGLTTPSAWIANRACLVAKTPGGLGTILITKSGANVSVRSMEDGDGTTGCSGSGDTAIAVQPYYTNAAAVKGGIVALTNVINATKVPAPGAGNTAIIEIVPNSGSYVANDCRQSSGTGYFNPYHTTGTVKWNFNYNELQLDFNVNDGSYAWTQSGAVGKTSWYYIPNGSTVLKYDGTQMAMTDPKCCTIGDHIFGDWNTDTNNLTALTRGVGAPSYKANNYAWGNFDGLAGDTLYVKMSNGLSPSHASNSSTDIWIPQQTYNIVIPATSTANIEVNDLVNSGSKAMSPVVYSGTNTVKFNRCIIANIATYSPIFYNVSGSSNYELNCNIFTNSKGPVSDMLNGTNVTWNNNLFWKTYSMGFLDAIGTGGTQAVPTGTYIWTYYNNSSYKLYAEAFSVPHAHDIATLVETNNQFYMDPDSDAGGKGIAYILRYPLTITVVADDGAGKFRITATGSLCTDFANFVSDIKVNDRIWIRNVTGSGASLLNCVSDPWTVSNVVTNDVLTTTFDLAEPDYDGGLVYTDGNCYRMNWYITDVTDIPSATNGIGNDGTDPNVNSVGKPIPGSVLFNNGLLAALPTTDYEGKVWVTPDIGAYRMEPMGGGLSPGLGLSGGNRPPWWRRRRR